MSMKSPNSSSFVGFLCVLLGSSLLPFGSQVFSEEFRNLSARHYIGSSESDDAGYVEFEITDTTDILLRHVGPSLPSSLDYLSDPTIELYDALDVLIGSNDDWGGDAAL